MASPAPSLLSVVHSIFYFYVLAGFYFIFCFFVCFCKKATSKLQTVSENSVELVCRDCEEEGTRFREARATSWCAAVHEAEC